MRRPKQSWFISFLKPVLLVVLLFLVFGVVWLRSSVVSLEYSISSLEKKRSELMRESKTLAAEQANLLYIGRIRSVAFNGIGLEFPDRVRVVYVNTAPDRGFYRASFHPGETGDSHLVKSE